MLVLGIYNVFSLTKTSLTTTTTATTFSSEMLQKQGTTEWGKGMENLKPWGGFMRW